MKKISQLLIATILLGSLTIYANTGFRAPTHDTEGNPLTGIIKVALYCNSTGEQSEPFDIAFENGTYLPGQIIEGFPDMNVLPSGNYWCAFQATAAGYELPSIFSDRFWVDHTQMNTQPLPESHIVWESESKGSGCSRT